MSFLPSFFYSENFFVLLFYIFVIFLIYWKRKNFEWHGIIGLYKTKKGINLINKFAKKYRKAIILFGYLSIIISYIGMAFIAYTLIKGLIQLLFVPQAPPTVTPILPGVKIPGSNIKLPLIQGLIALFVVVVVHEFSHGIVAKAHGIKIKSSGLALFGPLPGAFVEPDEKAMDKANVKVQQSIVAAGPVSNFVLALIMVALMFLTSLAFAKVAVPAGFTITDVAKDSPAALAGMKAGMTFYKINNETILSADDFINFVSKLKPNQTLTFYGTYNGENVSITLTTGQHPQRPERGYIGIYTSFKYANEKTLPFIILAFLSSLLWWIFILNLGIGLANLIPIGPIDGGRIFYLAISTFLPKKKAEKITYIVSIFFAIILIANLVLSLI